MLNTPAGKRKRSYLQKFLFPAAILSLTALSNLAWANSRLADAASQGDSRSVESLLAAKADVNATQADGMTALHWAVRRGDIEIMDWLLKAGANARAETHYGITPLHIACGNGNAAEITRLLASGAQANEATPGGETPLMTASRTGKVPAIQVLLDHGATVNAHENERGQTALMWAAIENHVDAAKLLLAHGAEVNAQTTVSSPEGEMQLGRPGQGSGAGITRQRALPSPTGAMTALLYAARQGWQPMAQVLLDAGADINLASANGSTPLLVAILNNHVQLAQFLLDHHADPNRADFYGRAALFAAVEMRNLDYVRFDPDPEPDPGDPLKLIQALLARGASPNTRAKVTPVRGFMQNDASWIDLDGQTPFLRAALTGDVTVMRMLLASGADPNIATTGGTTALMLASGLNWVRGRTRSHSDQEYKEAIELCIEHGADVNAKNSLGLTAMHGAANRGADFIVELLVAHGASVDVKDNEGRTPMTFAEGVFLAIYPPMPKPSTIALLQKLSAQTTAERHP